MSSGFKVWGGPSAPPPAAAEPDPQPEALEPEAGLAPPPGQPKPPGKAKIALIIAAQLLIGGLRLLARGGMKLVGFGLIALGSIGKLFSGSNSDGSKKKMSLRAVFLGAAVLYGGMMAPGAYYMTQSNDIVRTRVTGTQMADTKSEFPGQKYYIYTNQGKFDTYGVEGGKDIKAGCVYDFNVKSARLEVWPPGYTRSIVSYKPVPDAPCRP